MRFWPRHRCPPDVELTICVNGAVILGPMTGEQMAYIAKYGGFERDQLDLMEGYLVDQTRIDELKFLVRYVER